MSLSSIIGVVEDLIITGTTYEDVVFKPSHRNVGGAVAVGAAVMGQFASSAMLASSVSSGAEIPMTGFTCSVNGQTAKGAFYKVGFVENEVIEFIGEQDDEGVFMTVAARSASQKIIWTIPYHGCGHIANKRSIWKWGMIFSSGAALVTAAMLLLLVKVDPAVPIGYRVLPAVGMFLFVLLVNYWARSHFTKFARNATLILEAFGYPNPGEVDLQAEHELADEKFRLDNPDAPRLYASWCYRF